MHMHMHMHMHMWRGGATVHPGRSGSSGMISTRTDPLEAGWVEARSTDDRSVGAAAPRPPPPPPPPEPPPPPQPPPPEPPPPRAVAAASGRAGADPRRFAPGALGANAGMRFPGGGGPPTHPSAAARARAARSSGPGTWVFKA